jgi:uncharacterized membrane protein
VPTAPRWASTAGTLIAAAGVVVAGDLTYAHYHGATVLACPDRGIVNCAKVTTSSYSVIAGVPVAVIGLAYFAVMVVLELPWSWRLPLAGLRGLRLAAAAAGAAMAIWLVYVELFRLDAICLYCTAVHGLALALFAVTALGAAWTDEDEDEDPATT